MKNTQKIKPIQQIEKVCQPKLTTHILTMLNAQNEHRVGWSVAHVPYFFTKIILENHFWKSVRKNVSKSYITFQKQGAIKKVLQ